MDRMVRKRKVRYISVFSGIEAATVAWEPLGWEPVAFCEIEAFPSAVLAHRFPNVPNLGDITKVDWRKYRGEIDIIVGGSPCQSFSIAGNREGLKGESGLMFEYIRAVREVMPRCFIWENVPGALSCEKGAAFGQLLSKMDALGYGLAWRVLDAQFFDVAQRRERVFLVGCLGEAERAAEILFERESLRWDHPSSREKRKELAADAERGVGGSSAGFKFHQGSKAGSIGYEEEISPTITADWHAPAVIRPGKQIQAVICMADDNTKAAIDSNISGALKVGGSAPIISSDYIVRRLTPVECERLQGFPNGWTEIDWKGKKAPDGKRYKALGNSMAVPVMRWIGERIDAAYSGAKVVQKRTGQSAGNGRSSELNQSTT